MSPAMSRNMLGITKQRVWLACECISVMLRSSTCLKGGCELWPALTRIHNCVTYLYAPQILNIEEPGGMSYKASLQPAWNWFLACRPHVCAWAVRLPVAEFCSVCLSLPHSASYISETEPKRKCIQGLWKRPHGQQATQLTPRFVCLLQLTDRIPPCVCRRCLGLQTCCPALLL